MRFFILFALFLLLALPVGAQEDEDTPTPGATQNFSDLLRLIPLTNDLQRTYIEYGDIRAAESGRGIIPYASWSEFDRDQTRRRSLWVNSVGLAGGEFMYLDLSIRELGMMPDIMGFDFFEIDRSLEFGSPPAQGFILQGDTIDVTSVDSAHVARDYTQQSLSDLPAWCGAVGCTEGNRTDFANLEMSNIFGGRFGQQPPLAMIPEDGIVFASSDFDLLQSMALAHTEQVDSMLAVPDIAALVNSLDGYGNLRHAMLTTSIMSLGDGGLPEFLLDPALDLNNITSEPMAGLPPYYFMAIADLFTEEEQNAVIALSFFSADDAQAAANILPERLNTTGSVRATGVWTDILAERDITPQTPEVLAYPELGRWVVALSFTYPPATDEDEFGQVTGGSWGFSFFRSALFIRDLEWLKIGE